MAYPAREIRQKISLGQSDNAVTALIVLNLIIFVLLSFIRVYFIFMYRESGKAEQFFDHSILRWFELPASLHALGQRPWTLLTYMFSHVGILHILGNLLWLWSFGYIMQDLTGNRKIIPLYIYGGLGGALAYLLAYNLIPGLKEVAPVATLLGASAGIMGLAVGTTMVAPQYRIFPMLNGGIPLWILLVIYLVVDVASIPYNNAGGHISHLGGAAAGLIFMLFLRKGYDGSEWMNNFFDWVNDLFNPDKPKKAKPIKDELFYKSSGTTPFVKTPNITQQRVDAILDKISQKGFHFLTEEEKEILKRASKEDI